MLPARCGNQHTTCSNVQLQPNPEPQPPTPRSCKAAASAAGAQHHNRFLSDKNLHPSTRTDAARGSSQRRHAGDPRRIGPPPGPPRPPRRTPRELWATPRSSHGSEMTLEADMDRPTVNRVPRWCRSSGVTSSLVPLVTAESTQAPATFVLLCWRHPHSLWNSVSSLGKRQMRGQYLLMCPHLF